jgi:Asp-tRNA(Asn)/Glu-tRNA(Gln) amidotransferase A subunit family amidase
MQLVAPFRAEARLLAFAKAVETATGYATRLPALLQ